MKHLILLSFIALVSLTGAATIPECDRDKSADSNIQKVNVTCAHGTYPPPPSHNISTYIINLDLPPEERFKEVVEAKKTQIQHLLVVFKQFLLDFGKELQLLINFIDNDVQDLLPTLPKEYADEVRGVAKYSGLPLGEALLYNIFYEVFSFCTSIIAEDPQGNLYHARNMDFGLFLGWDIQNNTWAISEALRPCIVNLDFQSKNKTVFKSVNFAGFVGVVTGIKPGLFTMSMDTRHLKDGGYKGVIQWILGNHNASWSGYLTRQTFQKANSFEEAMDMLKEPETVAPSYFIVGGNKSKEGCVLTRSRQKTDDVWCMNETMWYILETNYDHWKKPLFIDDRRTPAMHCMNQMTQQNVSYSGIFNVLSTIPVFNKLTTYTALMQVNTGHLETYLQDCTDPKCYPF